MCAHQKRRDYVKSEAEGPSIPAWGESFQTQGPKFTTEIISGLLDIKEETILPYQNHPLATFHYHGEQQKFRVIYR